MFAAAEWDIEESAEKLNTQLFGNQLKKPDIKLKRKKKKKKKIKGDTDVRRKAIHPAEEEQNLKDSLSMQKKNVKKRTRTKDEIVLPTSLKKSKTKHFSLIRSEHDPTYDEETTLKAQVNESHSSPNRKSKFSFSSDTNILNTSIKKKKQENSKLLQVRGQLSSEYRSKEKNKNFEMLDSALSVPKLDRSKTSVHPFNISKPKCVQTNRILDNRQTIDQSETIKIIPAVKRKKKDESLHEKMMKKLKASHFRYLNEQLYKSDGKNSKEFFNSQPDEFAAYHEGYKQQVEQWPINPLDVIIESIKKNSPQLVIADFGCGDARLARSVPNKVHSFDLVAVSEEVTACNMAHTPLSGASVDIVVFCLSLMGNNLSPFLREASRVLKEGGLLKIAEVESRFENVDHFIQSLQKFGFSNTWKDFSHNLFYFMDFKKEKRIGKKMKTKLPEITLRPCLYKKR